jgi:hypothetical protein
MLLQIRTRFIVTRSGTEEELRHLPDAAAAALGHGHAGLAGAHLAGELIELE